MKTFNSIAKLESYVKTLSMVEKKALAKENNLSDAKPETIVAHFAPTHVVTEETETTVAENDAEENDKTATTEQTEDDNQSGENVGEKSKAKKEEDGQPTFSDEELKKIASHYNGKVKALTGTLDEAVGTCQKLAFMDGQMLDKTLTMLHGTAKSVFSIDVSSLPSGYFSNEENVKIFKNLFDIKALALASYDGTFKFDGKPVTKEIVQLALQATVSEFDKMESAIEKLRESEEYKLAVSTYAIFREQMLRAIEKNAKGAELSCAFEIRNPHKKTSAKGNSASISKADGERTYTRVNSGKVLKAGLHLTKKHALGEIVITTKNNGEWQVTCQPNDGDEKVWSYDNNQHTLSSAITTAYQAVTGSHGQKSVYVYLGEDNFVEA